MSDNQFRNGFYACRTAICALQSFIYPIHHSVEKSSLSDTEIKEITDTLDLLINIQERIRLMNDFDVRQAYYKDKL